MGIFGQVLRLSKAKMFGYLVNASFLGYGFSLVAFDSPLHITKLYAANVFLVIVYGVSVVKNGGIRRLPFTRPLIIYAIFTVYAWASIFWSDYPDASFTRARSLVQILLNATLILCLVNEVRTFQYLVYGLVLGVYLNLFILLGLVDIGWESIEGGWRFQGTRVKSTYSCRYACAD